MVLDPIPQTLPEYFLGSRPQPPTSEYSSLQHVLFTRLFTQILIFIKKCLSTHIKEKSLYTYQRNVSVHVHSSFFEHVSLHIYSSLLTRLFTHLKEMSLSTFKICVQRHFKDLSLNTLRSLYTYTHLSFNTSLYTKTRLFEHVTHIFIF